MMRLPPFRFHAARSLSDAASALADGGPSAMLLAGGTDLLPNMKRLQQVPQMVIGLRRVAELRARSERGGELAIGACTTLSEIAEDRLLGERYRALARAAAQVATPHLRHMGTLGGNLCLDTRCTYYNQGHEWRQAIDFCMKAPGPAGRAQTTRGDGTCWVAPGSPRCWAVSSTDTAPALIALGARVRLSSRTGEREIPLEQLYADDGMAFLAKRHDEILSAVLLPPAGTGQKSTYWKLRRRGSFDFPVLSVAASLRLSAKGIVEEARVVLGAVASRPLLTEGAAKLVGHSLTDDAIEAFAEEASRLAKPLDNTDFALGWRKRVARTYLAGALRELRGDDPKTFGLSARIAASGG